MNRWRGCWSGSACCWSRVLRRLGLAGAAASLPLAWLLGYDWASALAGFYGLNAALAGLALALRYRSVWPPLLGMGLAVALQPLFGLLGLPALTAPFILACLLLHRRRAPVPAPGRQPRRAPRPATLLSGERWRRRASLVRCRIHHQEPR